MRVIKRYKNYHFYDTVDKVYLSLQEIASAYKDEQAIKFIVHDTQEDITNKTVAKLKRIQYESKINNIYSEG
jgi:polyhydroxyalkanoate synthesis regulator protein